MKLYNTYTRWAALANSRWIRVPIVDGIYAIYAYNNRYKYSILFHHIDYAISLRVKAVPIPNNTSINYQLVEIYENIPK